jgi:parallel beta-helix repeat protein
VALIGCTGITVQNLALSKNGQGVLLISTRNSTIKQNQITANIYGVWADSDSSHITLEQNDISDNIDDGVFLVGSNNNRITSNTITGNMKNGIRLEDSKGTDIVGNTIKANRVGGITLENNSDTIISENHIADHQDDMGAGIALGLTSNATISFNVIENNKRGLSIHDLSKNNIIVGNTIRNNHDGLQFYYTTMYGPNSYPISSNTFRNNRLDNNERNLWFDSSFVQDIDSSNTANGKPIYYWVNQKGKTVPPDAGYIVLINCQDITVENVDISKNTQGIMLYNTTNSLITKNKFSDNNGQGIYVWHSTNNIFSENEILANSGFGVYSCESSNNRFVKNIIANNERGGIVFENTHESNVINNSVTGNKAPGVKLTNSKNDAILTNYVAQNELGILLYYGTSQSQVIGNMITENNGWGIRIEGPNINSAIYHNDFIDNKVTEGLQVSIPWPADPNTWDDGKEGNYWSDYALRYPNASEVGNTGIADTPYFINENNIDRHPRVSPSGTSGMNVPVLSTPPSQEPTNTPLDTQKEPDALSTGVVAGALAASLAGSCGGLLFYFKKRKHLTNPDTLQ